MVLLVVVVARSLLPRHLGFRLVPVSSVVDFVAPLPAAMSKPRFRVVLHRKLLLVNYKGRRSGELPVYLLHLIQVGRCIHHQV